jgi:hypothetical protein
MTFYTLSNKLDRKQILRAFYKYTVDDNGHETEHIKSDVLVTMTSKMKIENNKIRSQQPLINILTKLENFSLFYYFFFKYPYCQKFLMGIAKFKWIHHPKEMTFMSMLFQYLQ